MLDSYRGTVDGQGETLEDALAEVQATLRGAYGRVIGVASAAIYREGILVSALITVSDEGRAIVAFVMTRPSAQRLGLATALLNLAAANLHKQGKASLDLYVTSGAPGEALYERLGYREVYC